MDFSYLKEKMPKFHAKLLDTHIKLYKGYVAQVNFIDSKLQKENSPFLLQSLRKQYGFEYDGMVLHELYFTQLAGNGKTNLRKRIIRKIIDTFSSIECFKSHVKSYAKTRGIGWVVLFGNEQNGDLKLTWIADHDKGLLAGWTPISVIDLWEHAYICQFGLDKEKYIDLVFEYTDWDVINTRYIKGCRTLKSTYKKARGYRANK